MVDKRKKEETGKRKIKRQDLRGEKKWLHEVRETTSDKIVIPLLWWMRQTKRRESTSDNMNVFVQQ